MGVLYVVCEYFIYVLILGDLFNGENTSMTSHSE